MFVVRFGYDLFGKTHRVPGKFWVSTRFFYVYSLPIFAKESWLVFDPKNRASWAGPVPVQIGRNATSIWTLRLRSATVFLMLGLIVALSMMFIDFRLMHAGAARNAYAAAMILGCVLFCAAVVAHFYVWLSSGLRMATFEQAMGLAREARLPETAIRDIETHFGQMPALREPVAQPGGVEMDRKCA